MSFYVKITSIFAKILDKTSKITYNWLVMLYDLLFSGSNRKNKKQVHKGEKLK